MTTAPPATFDSPHRTPDGSVRERVQFERIATIYAQTPQPLLAGALYSVMVGGAMFGRAPDLTVLVWVVMRLAVCFVRINETRLFNRDPDRLRRPIRRTATGWEEYCDGDEDGAHHESGICERAWRRNGFRQRRELRRSLRRLGWPGRHSGAAGVGSGRGDSRPHLGAD